MNSPRSQFFATAAKGMEPLLVQEMQSWVGEPDTLPEKIVAVRGGVKFEGTLAAAYRACLWSRIANRILLPLKTFAAPDEQKLYGGVKSIRWSEHLTPEQTLAVDFSTSDSAITHSHF